MSRIKIAITALIAAAIPVVLPGCARWTKSHITAAQHDKMFAITADKTSFYRYGPQQARGPDRELTKDTLVTLIRHSFGYSKVRLDNGEQGFVANEDLGRAPDRLVAQQNGTAEDLSDLPPTPQVKLPTSDGSPEFEPTPIPHPLMPQ